LITLAQWIGGRLSIGSDLVAEVIGKVCVSLDRFLRGRNRGAFTLFFFNSGNLFSTAQTPTRSSAARKELLIEAPYLLFSN
jgi:hypothetical protein